MGAVGAIETMTGSSPQEAFGILCQQMQREYGEDPYNGTLSTCNLGRCVKRFGKYSETNKKQAYKLIDKAFEDGTAQKWRANYIDLGVKKYIVTEYKLKKMSNSPKYKIGYIVKSNVETDRYFSSKTEAYDYALKTAPRGGYLWIEKGYYLMEGNSRIAEVEANVKEYKKKPARIKAGAHVEEVHEYIFFGYAAE